MKRYHFLLAFIFSIPFPLSIPFHINEVVIWNVGQGLWISHVLPTQCHHFDTGGEIAPWRLLDLNCRKKRNLLNFSHWDWDHLNHVKKISKRWDSVCLMTPPGGESLNDSKNRIIETLKPCSKHFSKNTSQTDPRESTEVLPAKKNANPNDSSRIYLLFFPTGHALLPGDSSKKAEKQWATKLPNRKNEIELLILGHHGSNSSTSENLLNNLKGLKWAVASARKRVYGHPHTDLLRRLKRKGVAVLSTDDWGTIRWQRPIETR